MTLQPNQLRPSPISATVDFDADGVQHGFLKLPISTDESAWGAVMIPVTVVKNGEGPTALLTGGNHGDEYEGITSLLKLSSTLKAEDVTGRVIIVPCMLGSVMSRPSSCSLGAGGRGLFWPHARHFQCVAESALE